MIVVDAETLCFERWNLADLKHFCVVGRSCIDRHDMSPESHGVAIQSVLTYFLRWYDAHWLQPVNFPFTKDDDDLDWIQFARLVISSTDKKTDASCVIS